MLCPWSDGCQVHTAMTDTLQGSTDFTSALPEKNCLSFPSLSCHQAVNIQGYSGWRLTFLADADFGLPHQGWLSAVHQTSTAPEANIYALFVNESSGWVLFISFIIEVPYLQMHRWSTIRSAIEDKTFLRCPDTLWSQMRGLSHGISFRVRQFPQLCLHAWHLPFSIEAAVFIR